MNILFLLTQSLESPSGLGRYAPLARHLSALNHRVTIIALHPDFINLKERILEIEGYQVLYVSQMHVRKQGNVKSYFSTPALLWLMATATWRICLAGLRVKADIIHIGKPHPMNGIAGWVLHILSGSQLWLDCDDYETESGRFSSRYQQNVVAWFEKHLPKMTHRITTNTHFMQEKLVSWGVNPQKIILLTNGVDPDRFSTPLAADVETLRNELYLKGSPVILYVGSLSLTSHPLNLLLDAFVQIQNKYPEAKLVVVGGGEDYDHIRQLAEKLGIWASVRFCGRVPAERVVLYYHLANVSVDPVYDNDAARGRSPLKLFESWLCGIPYVSGDVGDRRILLGEPPAGLLAHPGDPASLAGEISKIISNPDLAMTLRQRGLVRVKEFYWNLLVKDLEVLYRGILDVGS